MADRLVPASCPRFGYVMVADGRMVGVLLTIFAPTRDAVGVDTWCNLSSWYVDPDFRPYATLLDRAVIGRPETTFINMSPAPHTIPAHEARGFRRAGAGQVVAVPALARAASDTTVHIVDPEGDIDGLSEQEGRLLRDHAAFGCISLVGRDSHGSEPFVFVRHPIDRLQRRMGVSFVHYALLIYLRSPAASPRHSAAIS